VSREINNQMATIDTRDITERVEELEESRQESRAKRVWDAEFGRELKSLQRLAREAESYGADSEILVRDSHFIEHAKDVADSLGRIDHEAEWPACHIDWSAAADDLQSDYTAIDFDGVTYWVRS
jgi:hypothetical protein